MCEFVANHKADAAHVDGVIQAAVEKRRLKNAGGEEDLIVASAVISVHRGGGPAPILLFHRLADLLQLPVGFKLAGAMNIAQQVSTRNSELAVVAPLVGVADFIANSGNFVRAFFFFG